MHVLRRFLRPVPVIYVTRFNLAMFGGLNNNRFVNLDKDWLSGRLDLFDRYCAPKMAQQTDGRFRWLILIDPATDDGTRARLRQAPNAELVEVPPETPIKLALRGCIRSGRVITARLDSDDQVSARYTEALRNIRWHCGRFAIYFMTGFDLDAATGTYYGITKPVNQFAAAFERSWTGRFKTVHCRQYHRLPGAMPTMLVRSKVPMWCTVVHGGNVANKVRGTPTGAPPIDW